MKLDELRSSVAALKSEIETLAGIEEINPEQDARLSAALDEFEARKADLEAAEARAARIEAAKSVVTERAAGFDAPQIMKRTETNVDVRSASRMEIRDAALKIVEKDGKGLAARQLDHVDRLQHPAADFVMRGGVGQVQHDVAGPAGGDQRLKTVGRGQAPVGAEGGKPRGSPPLPPAHSRNTRP